METVNLSQGSPEWLAYRATMHNASDAPAMLGKSLYTSRAELLKQRATGLAPEPDAATQRIFNQGHRFEALARIMAEKIVDEVLAPITGKLGKLSASFDGITFMGDIIWEHKTLNNRIRKADSAEALDPDYRIQMEQQLLISGAEKCLFMASNWTDDGDLLEYVYHWYFPDMALREQIVAGWEQFEIDLKNYTIVDVIEQPKADPIAALPVVTVQAKGELTVCNLADITPLFDRFLSEAVTTLVSDEDFATAEAQAKAGRATAKNCRLSAKAAIDQMATVRDVVQTLELYADRFDKLALQQEKAVKQQKETLKAAAKLQRDQAYNSHIADLEHSITPVRLVIDAADKPDFAAAMKGKQRLDKMHEALDAELARAKVAANLIAEGIKRRLMWLAQNAADYRFLFNDLQTIVYKQDDYFQLLANSRIEQHKHDEAERLAAERQRIEAEAKAKAEAEAKATLERERQRIEAEARLKAEAEAEAKAKAAVNTEVIATPAASPESLRQRAKAVQQTAEYADRNCDRQRDLDYAAELLKQADAIEKQAPESYRYNLTITSNKGHTLALKGELTADSKAQLLALLNIHPQQQAA